MNTHLNKYRFKLSLQLKLMNHMVINYQIRNEKNSDKNCENENKSTHLNKQLVQKNTLVKGTHSKSLLKKLNKSSDKRVP